MTAYYADPQVEANIPMKTRVVSGEHVPAHDVQSLPGTVETDINSSNGFLSNLVTLMTTLAGAVTATRVAVDLTTAVTGYLSTLAGTVSASRVAVDLTSTVTGYLSTLAGAVSASRVAVNVDSTTQGKLDTLHTDVGPASTIYSGNKNVTTAGTAVALAASQALIRGVRVRAKDANTGLIYIGGSGVTNGSDRLSPSEPTWIDINNLANVYIDAAVSGEGVTYSAW